MSSQVFTADETGAGVRSEGATGSESGSYRPPHDCSRCRVGQLTVPCGEGDVRRIEGVGGDNRRLYRTQVVAGEGTVPCPIMLIGEAPGFHEDREGLPFRPTAPAGRVLKRAMDEAGLTRWMDATLRPTKEPGVVAYTNDWLVYITNVLKCRPEDNKAARFPDAVEICRSSYLRYEIAAVQPKVIVCLGKIAAQPWFGSESSLAFRAIEGRLFIHAPHPSNIARGNTDNYPKLLNALRTAKAVAYEGA